MDLRFTLKINFLLLSLSLLLLSPITGQAQTFPVPPEIAANVQFWKRIYATYPTTKGVIHDSEDLSVVYEVINLVDQCKVGHRKTNRARIKKVKAKYKGILKHLASGKKPVSGEQRRVAALFGLQASSKRFKQATKKIRFQLGQRDRFIPGVIRSGQYLTRIKEIFRNHGLPEDLAYLPHVESSYNYKAYSKFGAAGMWQFIRSTGRRYMQVDYVVDERRDPIASSHAAAKFLKDNYQALGSWPLAITAYNHGASGVARAKRQKGSYSKIFSEYNGPRFRFASRNFYPSFIAARQVAKNYQRYFGYLRLEKPVQYHVVELKGYTPIAEVTDFFNVGAKALRDVNPALRPPVFEGQKYIPKGYKLRLPGKRRKMAMIASAMPSTMFRDKQKRSRFYRVQRGDTAGKIARRNGVSLNDLKIANGLSRRATIYVGQNLRIPGVGEQPTTIVVARRQDSAGVTPSMKSIKSKILTAAKKKESRSSSAVTEVAALNSGSKWRQNSNPQGLKAAEDEIIVLAKAEKVEVQPSHVPAPVVPALEPAAEPVVVAPVSPVSPVTSVEPVVLPEPAAVPEPAPVPPVVFAKIISDTIAVPATAGPLSPAELKELLSDLAASPVPAQPEENATVPEPVSAPPELLASHPSGEGKISTAATVETMMESLLIMPAEPAEPTAEPEAEVESKELVATPAAEEKVPTNQVNPLVLTGNFSVADVKPYKNGEMGTIMVEAEETLGHYADWLEIPTRKIRRLNRFRFGRPIHYGQKLKLPFIKISKVEFEERRMLYHRELMEDFFQAFTVTGEISYTIKKGDNLWTLCNEDFDLPFWLLQQYNVGFDFRSLRLGSVIKVPVVANSQMCPPEEKGNKDAGNNSSPLAVN